MEVFIFITHFIFIVQYPKTEKRNEIFLFLLTKVIYSLAHSVTSKKTINFTRNGGFGKNLHIHMNAYAKYNFVISDGIQAIFTILNLYI